ncbi:hypothetical protein ACQ4LE_000547 [Meloidogyne hapla]
MADSGGSGKNSNIGNSEIKVVNETEKDASSLIEELKDEIILRKAASVASENVIALKDRQIANIIAEKDQEIANIIALKDREIANIIAEKDRKISELENALPAPVYVPFGGQRHGARISFAPSSMTGPSYIPMPTTTITPIFGASSQMISGWVPRCNQMDLPGHNPSNVNPFFPRVLFGQSVQVGGSNIQGASANIGNQPVQQKQAKTRFTDDQIGVLMEYFDINKYPTEEQIKEAAQKTNLTTKQIKGWYKWKYFKERHHDANSIYNFDTPPQTRFDVDTYNKTGEVKLVPLIQQKENQTMDEANVVENDEEKENKGGEKN